MERLQSHPSFVAVVKQRHKVVTTDVVVHYRIRFNQTICQHQTIPQSNSSSLDSTPAHRTCHESAESLINEHYKIEDPQIQQNDQPCIRRLGLAVSKKVGKAVARNKIKRRFRVIAALYEDQLPPYCDIVIRARNDASTAHFEDLCHQIAYAFKWIREKSLKAKKLNSQSR